MSNQRCKTVWNPNGVLFVILGAAFAVALALPASAQSLNPKSPTPMVAGENRGTLDCMVGPQYWSFKYKKGTGKFTVGFTSMGLFGNPMNTTIYVVLHDKDGQVMESRSLTSGGKVAQLEMPGTFVKPGIVVIEIRTNGTCLVRAGGDYTIAFSGNAIDFDGKAAAAGPDRIVGSYVVMICGGELTCEASIHFSANGTVQTSDGHSGTWKVFDPDAMIYSLVVGKDRWSLKLVPGRGLFKPNDLATPVLQAVR